MQAIKRFAQETSKISMDRCPLFHHFYQNVTHDYYIQDRTQEITSGIEVSNDTTEIESEDKFENDDESMMQLLQN